MLPGLLNALREVPAYRAFKGLLPAPGAAVSVGGLAGSAPAVLVAALAEDFPQRVVLVVSESPADAERWLADLAVLRGEGTRLYPQREALGEEEPHLEIAGERVETIAAVLGGQARVVVTTLRATAERTRMPAVVAQRRFGLRRGDALRPAEVAARLEAMGFARRPSVLDVAQFAVRGGILDVYGFGMAGPTRIEWWGDEIVSIRRFDLETQRSEGEVQEVTILPVSPSVPAHASEGGEAPDRQSLLDLLPSDTLLVVDTIDLPLTLRHPRKAVARLDGHGRPWWWTANAVGLASGAVQRGHQQAMEILVQRVGTRQGPQLAHDLAAASLDHAADRLEQEVFPDQHVFWGRRGIPFLTKNL